MSSETGLRESQRAMDPSLLSRVVETTRKRCKVWGLEAKSTGVQDISMPNPTWNQDWLDELCEHYENQWAPDRSGPQVIVDFCLQKTSRSNPQLPTLLEQLVEMDVERSWMHWRLLVSEKQRDYGPNEWLKFLSERPKLRDYIEIMTRNRVPFSLNEELLKTEYRARQEWGDAPSWKSIASDFPNLSLLPPAPMRHEVSIQSKEISCIKRFELGGLMEFGRQRSTDSQFGVVVHDDTQSRVIIASKTNSLISRKQFRLQILAAGHAILTNLSQVNPLNLGTSTILHSNASSVVELPFSLDIQGIHLSFS